MKQQHCKATKKNTDNYQLYLDRNRFRRPHFWRRLIPFTANLQNKILINKNKPPAQGLGSECMHTPVRFKIKNELNHLHQKSQTNFNSQLGLHHPYNKSWTWSRNNILNKSTYTGKSPKFSVSNIYCKKNLKKSTFFPSQYKLNLFFFFRWYKDLSFLLIYQRMKLTKSNKTLPPTIIMVGDPPVQNPLPRQITTNHQTPSGSVLLGRVQSHRHLSLHLPFCTFHYQNSN